MLICVRKTKHKKTSFIDKNQSLNKLLNILIRNAGVLADHT